MRIMSFRFLWQYAFVQHSHTGWEGPRAPPGSSPSLLATRGRESFLVSWIWAHSQKITWGKFVIMKQESPFRMNSFSLIRPRKDGQWRESCLSRKQRCFRSLSAIPQSLRMDICFSRELAAFARFRCCCGWFARVWASPYLILRQWAQTKFHPALDGHNRCPLLWCLRNSRPRGNTEASPSRLSTYLHPKKKPRQKLEYLGVFHQRKVFDFWNMIFCAVLDAFLRVCKGFLRYYLAIFPLSPANFRSPQGGLKCLKLFCKVWRNLRFCSKIFELNWLIVRCLNVVMLLGPTFCSSLILLTLHEWRTEAKPVLQNKDHY